MSCSSPPMSTKCSSSRRGGTWPPVTPAVGGTSASFGNVQRRVNSAFCRRTIWQPMVATITQCVCTSSYAALDGAILRCNSSICSSVGIYPVIIIRFRLVRSDLSSD